MLSFCCRAGLTGLATLLLFVPLAPAQRRTLYPTSPAAKPQQLPYQVNPNQSGPTSWNHTPQQMTYNSRMTGRAEANLVNPSLHAGSPYVGAHSNYNLVTPAVGGYGGYGYGGYGYPSGDYSTGGTLQGLASYTQAYGQYQIQTQQASQMREQRRQMSIDTQRKQMEFEQEYERNRLTTPKLVASQQATDLDWARNHVQNSEIWSGKTLNVLLDSIMRSPYAAKGPTLSLESNQLLGLNLTDGTTRSNLSLAKDEGKIAWTEALQEEAYDTVRDGFAKGFDAAVKMVESGQQPTTQTLRGLRADLKKLEDRLDEEAPNITPDAYIGSKRLLNQLKDTVKGLSDPRIVKSCKSDWKKNVHNVGELVEYLMKNGLKFGPAVAPGDETSYTSTYYAMRTYERSLAGGK